MPIRAAFDARVLERPELAERGIGRYAACLLDAYAEAGLPVTPLRNLRRPPAPARFAEAFEHLLLARDVKRAGTDVLHQPSIDYASLRPGAPLVVTVHDLVPLKRPAVFRPVADPRAALGRLNLPGRFVLWVGGLDPPDPRKGVAALVNAVARRDGPPLVLAGRVDAEAEHLAVPGRVLLAGRVTDDELAALYSAADALVFPSAEEGFGLPPVEALACGTPVAAFASAALGETLAGAQGAVLVEPGDLDALLDAAASLTGTRAAAPPRSWADVARETWAVLEQAAQSPQLR
jgi:glycosyltransferase involved in cell wall biosynthesis